MIGSRENRGKIIAQKQNQIIRIDNNHYKVNSQSRNKQHDIISLESGWSCSCEDHYFRKTCCQHIHAVEFSLQLREQVKQQVTIQEVNMSCCKFCNSENFTKWGIRHNKNYDIQIFKCKDYSKKFSMNLGFEGLKAKPEMVTASMNLYFNGESTRHVADSMKLFGTKITHVTVQNWIKKYVRLMEKYLELITPKVSEKWRTDEITQKLVNYGEKNKQIIQSLMADTKFSMSKWMSLEEIERRNVENFINTTNWVLGDYIPKSNESKETQIRRWSNYSKEFQERKNKSSQEIDSLILKHL